MSHSSLYFPGFAVSSLRHPLSPVPRLAAAAIHVVAITTGTLQHLLSEKSDPVLDGQVSL